MATIDILYNINTFDNLKHRVDMSKKFNDEERNILLKMLEQMEKNNFLLYMIEILKKESFNFDINNFEKYHLYLVHEVYKELIDQLIKKYETYEDVAYQDIRKWFFGMSFDLTLITIIDRMLKEKGVRILY